MEPLVIEGIRHAYIGRGSEGVNLTIRSGEICALMGPSGSGKSTLLSVILGISDPTAGSVSVGGSLVNSLTVRERAALRWKSIGSVQQQPDLLPELTVLENVELPLVFDRALASTATQRARELLSAVGLDGHEDQRVDSLSGGEAQRVSIARALSRPGLILLLADEPTAALDRRSAQRVFDVLRALSASQGVGCLLATHDPFIADQCDEIQRLGDA